MKKDEIIVQKIKKLLDQNNIRYEYLEHRPTLTSEDAMKIRNNKSEEGAKALILKAKKSNKNFMVVLPGNLKIDSKAVNNFIGEDIEFEKPDIILIKYGLEIGGVPPFWDIISEGTIDNLESLIDDKLLTTEKLAFNCGKRTCSIIMKTEDFEKVVKGRWGKFSK